MTDRTTLLEHEEAQRLTNLLSLNILDTPPQREFDELTRMAALACDAASAAITLVDADRVWCKSRVCVDVEEIGREHAFCSLDVARGDILVIPDTWLDERCRANPLIAGDKAIRFYAGFWHRLLVAELPAQVPFDKIKIDQSFVRQVPDDPESAAIVRAIITMSSCLGIATTVEGVETGEQMAFSVAEGCDTIQGYHVSRPLPAQAFQHVCAFAPS